MISRFWSRTEALEHNGLSTVPYRTILAALVTIHVGLVLYFEPLDVVFSRHPFSLGDYYFHFLQAFRFVEGMAGWGKSWVYDVQLLAGYPVDTLSDADNKAWELWTYGMWMIGMPLGAAFNSFLLLAHLMVAPTMYFSARLFGLKRIGVLIAVALGTSLWFFDSSAHFCWYAGMGAYCFAGYLFLLPFASFYRYIRDKPIGYALLAALLLGIVLHVHPYSFFALVVPMSVLYLQSAKSLTRRQHATVVGIAIVAIAFNARWILVAIDFWRYVIDSAFYGQTTIIYLPADFLGIALDYRATGKIEPRTAFRFLAFTSAFLTIVLWQKSKDRRFLCFAIGISVLIFFGYLGGYFKTIGQIQPYRLVYPALFLAVIPAAALIDILIERGTFRDLPQPVYFLIFLLSFPCIQNLARDIVYFFPNLFPVIEELKDKTTTSLNLVNRPGLYRHRLWNPSDDILAEWVKSNDNGTGRFLVEFESPGEQLPWKTKAEIIGGFSVRNLEHTYANIFRPQPLFKRAMTDGEFLEYLETYAIKWIILPVNHIWNYTWSDLLDIVVKNFYGVRIYRTRFEPSYFHKGSGKIKAHTNRIVVSDSDPNEDIVVRYQWIHTLKCHPKCTARRYSNKYTKVGFIEVPAPHPSRFVIENDY